MHIFVLSRPEAVELCDTFAPKPGQSAGMVSISTPEQEYSLAPHTSKYVQKLLLLSFYDVGGRDPSGLPQITEEQARSIAQFVYSCHNSGMDIIVHCDGGISRSAGVACAIADHFGISRDDIIKFHAIYPNMYVRDMVLKELLRISRNRTHA